MKSITPLILAILIHTLLASAKSSPKNPSEDHLWYEPQIVLPDWVGGTPPSPYVKEEDDQSYDHKGDFVETSLDHQYDNAPVFFHQGVIKDNYAVNERADKRRGKDVPSPPPASNWNLEKWHYPPSCDGSQQRVWSDETLWWEHTALHIVNFLAINPTTTITLTPGTWITIGIPGFIVWVYWGEDDRGTSGPHSDSTITLPLSYVQKALEFRDNCSKMKMGAPLQTYDYRAWGGCVHDEAGRPLEVCFEKRNCKGKLVDHIEPGQWCQGEFNTLGDS